jgi:asparagine synthase (glutamine-hydrolysing)
MCGICGFTGNVENGEQVLQKMTDIIAHRGPDGAGTYRTDDVALGHRRLSIIDLDLGGQPMFSADRKIAIVFNGEIYNYKEIQAELKEKGYTFATNCDTEVLIVGYQAYGVDILQRVRGMFAFALWDEEKRQLFAARDFFGIKPFYYAIEEGHLIFGSEIKSILEHPLYKKEMNPAALEQYLTFQYSVLPETFFKGVYKLMPGHYMIFRNGVAELERYWQPDYDMKEDADLDTLVDQIDAAMQDSVKYHMVSDVEVGSFLSSGIDSSFLTASLTKNSQSAKTFTVGFGDPKYNEISYARELCEILGIEHNGKLITEEEFWDVLKTVQWHMDEPLADPAAVALYFVDREARKKVKVVLSGEGADELFGGYNIYHEPISLAGYQKLPKGLRKALAAAAAALPFSFKGKNFLIRGSKTVEERFIGNAYMFSPKEREKLLRQAPSGLLPTDLTRPFYDQVKDLDDTTKMQYIDLNFWMLGDILLKTDKMSMANSLESRVPFLDKEVFRVARTVPTRYKVTADETKFAMRKAANRYVPEAWAKKKKLGFPVPIRVMLKEDRYYNIVKKAFTGDTAAQFFHTEELVKLLEIHKSGKADTSRKIWTVYMFLLWYDVYFGEEEKAS